MPAAAWHIPRPSLSGSSSGGSVAGDGRSRGGSASSQGSASNHSTHFGASRRTRSPPTHAALARLHNRGRHHRLPTAARATMAQWRGDCIRASVLGLRIYAKKKSFPARKNYIILNSDSHGQRYYDVYPSTPDITADISYMLSVSSGSLLLSAAHLARVHGCTESEEKRSTYRSSASGCGSGCGSQSRAHAVVAIPEEADSFWTGVKRGSASADDAGSVASSTHFTVVNGFTKHRAVKEPRTCCCRHSHQITVLVISMTILFSACILAAICFVEMVRILASDAPLNQSLTAAVGLQFPQPKMAHAQSTPTAPAEPELIYII
ncbi:hypothetical protein EVAR_6567_1 [Eumeta japonica]|uniref:Uncharacterized protein n=1 Tax=Eumeta variegata TaxID=151549 RepID=A0A4C1SSY8_EUMVA|nr:hypothetical protein EVAR_6567_1 [Eumeta japonica]